MKHKKLYWVWDEGEDSPYLSMTHKFSAKWREATDAELTTETLVGFLAQDAENGNWHDFADAYVKLLKILRKEVGEVGAFAVMRHLVDEGGLHG